MNITKIYGKEKRDPDSIKQWLLRQGHSEKSIDLALAEFAQRIIDGETFGYVNGISVLSNRIKQRVRRMEAAEDINKRFGEFVPRKGVFGRIKDRIKKVFKRGN